MLVARGVEVEVRCRLAEVAGAEMPSEDELVELMGAAATELEQLLPKLGPVVFVEDDRLCAIGTFDAGDLAIDEAQGYTRQMAEVLLRLLHERVSEVATAVRELVPAAG